MTLTPRLRSIIHFLINVSSPNFWDLSTSELQVYRFDMHYGHVLKKLNFDLLTQRSSGLGLVGKIFATIFQNLAIHFILIHNMTML